MITQIEIEPGASQYRQGIHAFRALAIPPGCTWSVDGGPVRKLVALGVMQAPMGGWDRVDWSAPAGASAELVLEVAHTEGEAARMAIAGAAGAPAVQPPTEITANLGNPTGYQLIKEGDLGEGVESNNPQNSGPIDLSAGYYDALWAVLRQTTGPTSASVLKMDLIAYASADPEETNWFSLSTWGSIATSGPGQVGIMWLAPPGTTVASATGAVSWYVRAGIPPPWTGLRFTSNFSGTFSSGTWALWARIRRA